MRRAHGFTILLLVLAIGASAKTPEKAIPEPRAVADGRSPRASRSTKPFFNKVAMPDSFTLGDFTFDDSLGGPDPQGWTSLDRTAQLDTFFHVEDFVGLGANLSPISGNQSLWCGARFDSTLLGSYQTLPGYGNDWEQYFTFQILQGFIFWDWVIDFKIRYDVEDGFDFVYFQYENLSNDWVTAAAFTGQGDSTVSVTIPSGSTPPNVSRFRFAVITDSNFSDEDGGYDSQGACIIDDVVVSQLILGTIDSADFEAESPGDLGTDDGFWNAGVPTPFGDFAALYDGSSICQSDTAYTDSTHLWAFTAGGCTAVPFTNNPGSTEPGDYIDNDVISPWVSLTEDVDGNPVTPTDATGMVFDVYQPLPLDNLVFYQWRVRSMVNGMPTGWTNDGILYYNGFVSGTFAEWVRRAADFTDLIAPGATHVQVSLGVRDMCWLWCGVFGTGQVHSNGPLFDNVAVLALNNNTRVVTNTNDSGPGSLREALTAAIGILTVEFNIPGPGPHVIAPMSALPTLSSQTIVDGTTQPGYSGDPVIVIDGSLLPLSSANGLSVTADDCAIRGLAVHSFDGNGISIAADRAVIEDCFIGSDDGVNAIGNGFDGIFVSNLSTGTRIGGPDPLAANVIIGNGNNGSATAGVRIDGQDCSVRGNSIHSNMGLGIELLPGANADIAAPVLDAANVYVQIVSGTLAALPIKTYEVDFYSNTTCDPSGSGEGRTYLGSQQVTTDVSGDGAFAVDPGASFFAGHFITATITGPSENTSEFSNCVRAFQPIVVTNTSDSGAGSLRQAILDANAVGNSDVIHFDIPGSGPHTIQPLSSLPSLTQPVTIDGFSQPGASPNTNAFGEPSNAVLQIEINGGPAATGGIACAGAPSTIRGLCLSNGLYGVSTTSNGNTIEGCYIGTDIAGTVAVGNGRDGVKLDSNGNLVGGDAPDARNVISGNTFHGVGIGGSGSTATGNELRGNYIGSDATGRQGLGNGQYGVTVSFVDQNYIGPQTTGVGNLIFGNDAGGVLLNASLNDPNDNVIAENVIVQNGGPGIVVEDDATQNTITRNSIHDNAGLGIDLSNDGVTANDADDSDFGANRLQNYPALTSVKQVTTPSAGTRIQGTLTSKQSTIIDPQTFRIEFFSSPSSDPTTFGEGERYLGFTDVSTPLFPIGGDAVIDVTLTGVFVPGGHVVTATATDKDGNTSEFSRFQLQPLNTPSGFNVTVFAPDESGENPAVEVTYDDVSSAGNTNMTSSNSGPQLPYGYLYNIPPVYFDVTTTASFSGDIELCFTYDEATLPGPEADVTLLHYDTTLNPPAWVDVTGSLNTGRNEVCGMTTSLSPFVVAVDATPTGIGDDGLPRRFALHNNYPNPFNPTTTIAFDVPAGAGHVSLTIYDVKGRRVATLLDGSVSPGRRTVVWNAMTDSGTPAASGVYFYRLRGREFVETRKMVLLK